MSSIYNPLGSLVVPAVGAQQAFPITSSTNASPIKITLATPTAFNDQDMVEIQGHQTNTAANGVWQMSKIDSQNFFLNGSTGNGIGGATGTAQDFSLMPYPSVMGDGDALNATNLNTSIEGIANSAPFLYRMCGAYRMINSYTATFGDIASSVPTYGSTTTASSTYVNATGLTALVFGAGTKPCLQTNDLLQYTACYVFETQSGGIAAYSTLGFEKNGGSYSQVTNSTAFWTPGSSNATTVCLDGAFQPGSANTFDFSIMLRSPSASSGTWQFIGGGSIRINHYRLNG